MGCSAWGRKCKCILCSRTDALGDGGGRGGGTHHSPLSQGFPLRCHPSFLPTALRTPNTPPHGSSYPPTAMGTDRKLTLPQDLAVPAGKGSFKQPIYFPMKAFPDRLWEEQDRAFTGGELPSRLESVVGSFRGLTEAIASQSSITIFLLSPQLLYQSQEFHFPFLLF